MDLGIEELENIKKRISEILTDVAKEQEELDDILKFIAAVEDISLQQMSGSASSARSRRSKAKAKSIEEEKKEYEERREQKQVKIRHMWEKIHELQLQERKLSTKHEEH